MIEDGAWGKRSTTGNDAAETAGVGDTTVFVDTECRRVIGSVQSNLSVREFTSRTVESASGGEGELATIRIAMLRECARQQAAHNNEEKRLLDHSD